MVDVEFEVVWEGILEVVVEVLEDFEESVVVGRCFSKDFVEMVEERRSEDCVVSYTRANPISKTAESDWRHKLWGELRQRWLNYTEFSLVSWMIQRRVAATEV